MICPICRGKPGDALPRCFYCKGKGRANFFRVLWDSNKPEPKPRKRGCSLPIKWPGVTLACGAHEACESCDRKEPV